MQSPTLLRTLSTPIFIIILSLLAAASPVRADEADDEYLSILTIIEQGDTLNSKGQAAAALEKYRQARKAIIEFGKTYPKWNDKIIAYRLRDLGEKTDKLTEKIKLAAPGPATTPAAPATSTPKAASLARIKLVDAGAEPRSILRFHPKVGDKHTLNMLLKTTMAVNAGDTPIPPMKLPRITMAMDVTVTAISQDGDISYDMQTSDVGVADDPDATPAMATMLKAALNNFKGASGKGTVSNRGVSESAELKLPPNLDPQTAQMMDGMKDSISGGIMVFPEEPVGPGAKWEVKQKHTSRGLAFDETTDYELKTLDNDHLTAAATVTQEAGNQKISSPSMPGMKVDLNKMSGNGTGSYTVDLSQILPSESDAEVHTELAMGLGAGEQKQSMAMKMDVSVHLETK